uniref:CSON006287 protein n=1 Tax=Culicoides sonorensis TaxID=179676 RepID=A0A336L7V4_CULSO
MTTTMYCLAPGCPNNSKNVADKEPQVVFHQIKDDQKWHRFCSLSRRTRFPQRLCERPESAICSEHFTPSDYESQESHILYANAFPSIPARIAATKDICYICFTPSSQVNLFDFDPEVVIGLGELGLGLIEEEQIPRKLCMACQSELQQIVSYLDRVKAANDFWHKFGTNIGVINPPKDKAFYGEDGTFRPNKEIFTCKQCNIQYPGKSSLYKHVWAEHAMNRDDPLICSDCSKRFSSEYSTRSHYFQYHYGPGEQIVCSDCGFLARNSRHMHWHMKYAHDTFREDTKYLCEWCVRGFAEERRLDAHVAFKHPEKLAYHEHFKQQQNNGQPTENPYFAISEIPEQPIPQAKVEVKMGNEPVTNYEEDDYDDSHQMDYDDSADDSQSTEATVNVKKEKDQSESKPEKKPVIEKIKAGNKKAPAYISLKQKSRSTKDDITQKCPDCQIDFTGKPVMVRGGLYRHYWVRHARLNENPKQCRKCDKIYDSEHICRLHYFKLHFEVNYCCDICGKTDMTKFQLQLHIKATHVERAARELIVCRFCNRKYESVEEMKKHEENHKHDGKIRPYVCNECGKCYTNEMTLKNHIKQHLGIRNYRCNFCEMTFVALGNLKVHEVTHHTHKYPYKCSMCDKEFSQYGNIVSHIKTKHGSYDPEIVKNELIIRQHGRLSKEEISKQKKGSQFKSEPNTGQIQESYVVPDSFDSY